MATYFRHPRINNGRALVLRLSPTQVEWTYNLNQVTTPTYAGQVIQILSINFDKLTLEGRFGKEGPKGKVQTGTNLSDNHTQTGIWDYTAQGTYAIGLTQMTSYFQDYFAIASQGGDVHINPGEHYDQEPMIVSYDGALDNNGFPAGERSWKVYPTDFPSYSRSLQEFAPQWRVVFEIEEEDYDIKLATLASEVETVRTGIGYTQYWKYSDPISTWLEGQGIDPSKTNMTKAEAQYQSAIDQYFGTINEWLGSTNTQDFTDIILNGGSFPLNTTPQGNLPSSSNIDQNINFPSSNIF